MTARTAALAALFLLFLLGIIPSTAQEDTCEETGVCALGDVILQEEKISRFDKDTVIPDDALHVSANGNHVGWIVRVPRQEDGSSILPCHVQMVKNVVAKQIVAEYDYESDGVKEVDLRGPYRLVDEEGKVFPTETTSNRLHLLLPREAFIHEAVEEGFVRTLSDGNTKLTTLSLNPRVFLVDPILSKEECTGLINISSKTLQKSPEKHYSDAYKDYRTSWTGTVPRESKLTRKLWQRIKAITAMPDGGVEHPQLLKYDTNTSWYKKHHDFFHNFEPRPLEEVRLFAQTRAKELLRLNVSPEITQLLGDGSGIARFDPIRGPMSDALAETMVKGMNMALSQRVKPQLLLHHLLLISSEYPIEEFAIESVFYASLLLRAHGASNANARALAERYFQLEGVVNDDPLLPNYDLIDYVPYVVKPIQANRHVTVLPILQAADRGGNTAFPLAISNKMGTEPDKDEEFSECKKGLIVKGGTGQAIMFYNRLPRGELDYNSSHAGCPAKEGEKFAVNCFTWDTDQTFALKFLTPFDQLY